MKEDGFEYFPSDLSAVIEPETQWALSRDWIAEYGFGVSTQRFTAAQLDGRAVAAESDPADKSDPNQRYVSSLDETTQAAYLEKPNGDDGCISRSMAAQRTFEATVPDETLAGLEQLDFQSDTPLPQEFVDELAILQDDGVTTALVVSDCGGGVEYCELFEEIRIEIEKQIADQYADEIDVARRGIEQP